MPEPQTDPTATAALPSTTGSQTAASTTGAADDPARAEREARLVQDSQAYRSLKGRLKQAGLEALNADELTRLVALGRTAEQQAAETDEADDSGSDPAKSKAKAGTLTLAEHKEILRKDRESNGTKHADRIRALEAERDGYRKLYETSLRNTGLADLLGEEAFADYDPANTRDALSSDRVPFVLVYDGEDKALVVRDRKTGQEYRDPKTGSYLTPRDALAQLPAIAPYVKRLVLPGGSGAGTGTVHGSTPPGVTRNKGELTPLQKIRAGL